MQRIGVATSADLLTWTKHAGNPVLDADPRWYETHGGPSPWQDQHWRDPWVLADPDGDGWHLLITARATDGPIDDRGVIGHAWSANLTNWHARHCRSQGRVSVSSRCRRWRWSAVARC